MAQPLPAPAPPVAPPRPRRFLRRIALTFACLIGLLILIAAAAGLWFRSRMQASLPQLDGGQALARLAAPVEIERDDLGVPTVRALC